MLSAIEQQIIRRLSRKNSMREWTEEELRALQRLATQWMQLGRKELERRRVVEFQRKQVQLDELMAEAAAALGLGAPRAIPEGVGEAVNEDVEPPF